MTLSYCFISWATISISFWFHGWISHWLIASSAWDFRQSKRQNWKSCLAGWLQHVPAMVIMSISSFSFSSSIASGCFNLWPAICVWIMRATAAWNNVCEHFRNSHTIDASTIVSITNWQDTDLSLWVSLVQLFEMVYFGPKTLNQMAIVCASFFQMKTINIATEQKDKENKHKK